MTLGKKYQNFVERTILLKNSWHIYLECQDRLLASGKAMSHTLRQTNY